MMVDPLLPGWTEEGVLWEVIIKEGLSLSSKVEKVKIGENSIYKAIDEEKEQIIHVCLDESIDSEIVRRLKLDRDSRFICRDIALTDTIAANLALQCKLGTI